MNAAIYARKSTSQDDVDDEAKSVPRQIEEARAFAATKGWVIDNAYIYADDAKSGAETTKLVNRQRLLNIIHSGRRPPFQVLIVRDASRFSRRDGDEAFGELKRIAQAGVDIWYYQDGTRFDYGTLGDNVVGFVRAEWTRSSVGRLPSGPAMQWCARPRLAMCAAVGYLATTMCARMVMWSGALTRRRLRSCGAYSRYSPRAMG